MSDYSLSQRLLYGGTYRADVISITPDKVVVHVPQLFGEEPVFIYRFIAARPTVLGISGWVAFESERPELPIWVGANAPDEGAA